MNRRSFLLPAAFLFVAAACTHTASHPQFVYCPPAKFANCTTAVCEPKGSATPDDVSGITSFLQRQRGLGNLVPPVVVTQKK
jgi:hypothetical protein